MIKGKMKAKQEFKLELKNGITLCSELSVSEVISVPDVNIRDMENGYIWYALPRIELNGEKVGFDLCFFQSQIQCLNISLLNPEKYGDSWNDFSEAKDKLRAKDTEKWLSNIGHKAGKYPWGEIWSGYDSKRGFSSAVVRYTLKKTT